MPLIKCPDCGWGVSSQASACPNCGKPRTRRPAGQQVEYKELFLDWKNRSHDRIEYSDHGNWISLDQIKKLRLEAERLARIRIEKEIGNYLSSGWMFDGPYKTAIEIIWSRHNTRLWTAYLWRVDGARVRLRRHN